MCRLSVGTRRDAAGGHRRRAIRRRATYRRAFATQHGQGHHRGGNRRRDGARRAVRNHHATRQRRGLPRVRQRPREPARTVPPGPRARRHGFLRLRRRTLQLPRCLGARVGLRQRVARPRRPAGGPRWHRPAQLPRVGVRVHGHHVDRRRGRGAERLVVRRRDDLRHRGQRPLAPVRGPRTTRTHLPPRPAAARRSRRRPV